MKNNVQRRPSGATFAKVKTLGECLADMQTNAKRAKRRASFLTLAEWCLWMVTATALTVFFRILAGA